MVQINDLSTIKTGTSVKPYVTLQFRNYKLGWGDVIRRLSGKLTVDECKEELLNAFLERYGNVIGDKYELLRFRLHDDNSTVNPSENKRSY